GFFPMRSDREPDAPNWARSVQFIDIGAGATSQGDGDLCRKQSSDSNLRGGLFRWQLADVDYSDEKRTSLARRVNTPLASSVLATGPVSRWGRSCSGWPRAIRRASCSPVGDPEPGP